VAGSSHSEAQAADISPVPTTSCATKYERAKQHSEFLTSAPMKAVFIREKIVDKKKGKLHERKDRKSTHELKNKAKQVKRASKKTYEISVSFESCEEKDEVTKEQICDDTSDDFTHLISMSVLCGENLKTINCGTYVFSFDDGYT
jgi:hypothetical protein